MITAKDLRRALRKLPDNAPILFKEHDGAKFALAGYNTREAVLVYGARDDRYGSAVVLIELGADSP